MPMSDPHDFRQMPFRQLLRLFADRTRMVSDDGVILGVPAAELRRAIGDMQRALADAPSTWSPLKPATMTISDEQAARVAAAAGIDPATVQAEVRRVNADTKYFRNDTYQVGCRIAGELDDGLRLGHLSIKRTDQRAIHDWRDFQAIKSQLCGPECEAVELYPAQSREVDTSNQYHLWVVLDPTFRWPFGFADGLVLPPDDDSTGAVQRERAGDGGMSGV